MHRWAPPLAALLIVMLGPVAFATISMAQTLDEPGDGPDIFMVTFRGCEEACQGFTDFVVSHIPGANVTTRDIDRDGSLLPGLVEEVDRRRPDLLVTWGTSVTLGMIGTTDDHEDKITDIPTVFMIVADPLGAGIVEGYDRSGRPLVAGTLNRVPEATQMKALAEYRSFTKVGLVYNDTEINAILKADELRHVAKTEGFELVERVVETDADGVPRVDDIEQAVADVATQDIDFLYLGSSSFLLANADIFTSAALDNGVALATAYEGMVRDSKGLIALASAYYNVGQLAGFQAERILVENMEPGDLEVLGLDRFTVLINMETARALQLYPPMLLLRYAEIVGTKN